MDLEGFLNPEAAGFSAWDLRHEGDLHSMLAMGNAGQSSPGANSP